MSLHILLALLLATSFGTICADARPSSVEPNNLFDPDYIYAPDSELPELQDEEAVEETQKYPPPPQQQQQQHASQHSLGPKLAALTRHVVAKRSADPDAVKSMDDFIKQLQETSVNKTMRVCGKQIHTWMKRVCRIIAQFVDVLKNVDEVKFIIGKLKGEHTSLLSVCCYSPHGCSLLQSLPFAEEKCFYPPKQRRSALALTSA